MNAIIVTRHPALVQYLHETGIASPEATVISHATEEDIRGKDVIGVLPLRLAAIARTVTEIPLALEPEDRGKGLDIDRIREIAGEPVTYVIAPIEVHDVVQKATHFSGERGLGLDDDPVEMIDRVKRNKGW